MSIRSTICAWGALAALMLGGCMLDTTGPEPGEEPVGTDVQELVPGEQAPPAEPDVDEGAANDGEEDPAAPEEDVVIGWGVGDYADPSPDPWMNVDRSARDRSLDLDR